MHRSRNIQSFRAPLLRLGGHEVLYSTEYHGGPDLALGGDALTPLNPTPRVALPHRPRARVQKKRSESAFMHIVLNTSLHVVR